MSRIIAIDFGATTSSMATYQDSDTLLIANSEGEMLTPSVVAFTKTGQLLVGKNAKRQAATNLENTIFNFKNKLGSKHNYTINNKTYTPQEIASFLFQKLKVDAENQIGDTMSQAVISIPSFFDYNRRKALIEACELAGLQVLRLIPTPSAIGLNCLTKTPQKQVNLLVVDMGSSALSVSLLDIGDNVVDVRSTIGSNLLGGSNFDKRIYDHILANHYEQGNHCVTDNTVSSWRIMEAAERAKLELTSVNTTEVIVPSLYDANNEPSHLNLSLSRSKFNELTADLTKQIITLIQKVIFDGYINSYNIDKILLSGEATRTPLLHNAIKSLFPSNVLVSRTSDTALLTGLSLHSQVLSGENREHLLLEAYPFSISLRTNNQAVELIQRNSPMPTSRKTIITTSEHNQDSIEVIILLGNHQVANKNKAIERLQYSGIPPAPKGIPHFELSVSIDSNQQVTATIKDLGTGKKQDYLVKDAFGVNEEPLKYIDLDKPPILERNFEHTKSDNDKVETIMHNKGQVKYNKPSSTKTPASNAQANIDHKLFKIASLSAILFIMIAVLIDEVIAPTGNVLLLTLGGIAPAITCAYLGSKAITYWLLPFGVWYSFVGLWLIDFHQNVYFHHMLMIIAAISLVIMPFAKTIFGDNNK